MNVMEKWLEQYFDEEEPMDFYRSIFPSGELEKKGEYKKGYYTGIALCVSNKEKKPKMKKIPQANGSFKKVYVFNEDGTKKMVPKIYRFSLTDDLDMVEELGKRDDLFCLMAPISYAGKNRTAENARFMYAMAFDLDHIRIKDGDPIGLMNLWNGHIERAERLPKPTYIVSSGTGLHLYYVFEKAIPLFPNIVKQLEKLKYELTWMIWNEGIVEISSEEDIQQEGIFQGFRMPGTITKANDGSRARAFLTGEKVNLEYLNSFVREPYRVTEFAYKSKLSKAQAAELYPEWYEERIVQKKKGILHPWAVNRNLYDWWKREILSKAKVGHRYYCLMLLSAYAMKCSFYDEKKNPNPVTREELEADAFEIMEHFEELTDKADNHFTEADVLDALDAFDRGMLTYPRNSVEYRAGFSLPVNKRNGRKQADHIKLMNFVRDEINHNTNWRAGNGRKPKKEAVREWRSAHPNGTKAECNRETGIDPKTIRKWWLTSEEMVELEMKEYNEQNWWNDGQEGVDSAAYKEMLEIKYGLSENPCKC